MRRYGAALAVIVLAAGLSACGGGGSDFQAKYVEECKKAGGDKDMGDCACQAAIVDKDLNDKEKKAFLVMVSNETDPAKADQAMKDAGVTAEDMASMAGKMGGLMEKVTKECKK